MRNKIKLVFAFVEILYLFEAGLKSEMNHFIYLA